MALFGPHFALRTDRRWLAFGILFSPLTKFGRWFERVFVAFQMIGGGVWLSLWTQNDKLNGVVDRRMLFAFLVVFVVLTLIYVTIAGLSCVRFDRFYKD